MNQLDIQSVQRRLPGRRMDWHDTIDSTMHEAERLAAQGAAAGTAVIAEEQTAGLGRHGHSWYSELGAGLYVSIVLRPGLSSDALPVLMIALGLAAADAILVQMEIPLESVEATLRLGRRVGKPVILNPAPAQPLPIEWLQLARYLTPNQHELAILLGADRHEDFRSLMRRSPAPLVLTRGGEGAWFREDGEPVHQAGFEVDVVDTTGAGDTFNAALAVFLHEGLPAAVRKACAAAALSVTRLGAQGGMPTRSELDAFLAA